MVIVPMTVRVMIMMIMMILVVMVVMGRMIVAPAASLALERDLRRAYHGGFAENASGRRRERHQPGLGQACAHGGDGLGLGAGRGGGFKPVQIPGRGGELGHHQSAGIGRGDELGGAVHMGAELAHAAQYGRFDVIQVHRVPDHWKLDRELFRGLEVWRALEPSELYHSESWFEYDRFVLDSYDPNTVGGTGKACDWGIAQTLAKVVEKPILLAGGLHPGNVAEAIAEVKPWGVDVSSGVENEFRIKDIAKVEAFIAASRGA